MFVCTQSACLHLGDHHSHDGFAAEFDLRIRLQGVCRALHGDLSLYRPGDGDLLHCRLVVGGDSLTHLPGLLEDLEELDDETVSLHLEDLVTALGQLDPPLQVQKDRTVGGDIVCSHGNHFLGRYCTCG